MTGYESPDGEQSYSSTLSLTSTLDVVSSQRHVQIALPPGKRPYTHSTGRWAGARSVALALHAMFRSIPYNMNQQDAPFSINLFQ